MPVAGEVRATDQRELVACPGELALVERLAVEGRLAAELVRQRLVDVVRHEKGLTYALDDEVFDDVPHPAGGRGSDLLVGAEQVNYTWFETHVLPGPWHRGRVALIGDAAQVHLSTVYRTLDALTELGVVVHVHVPGGSTRYTLADAEPLHVHAQCLNCQRLIDLPAEIMIDLADQLRRSHSFVLDPGHVALSGTCSDCLTEQGHTPPAAGP